MGLRFQRRMRILPGVRLNLSASGVGLSVGTRGAHIGITSRGQRYWSAGIPGTGLSVRGCEPTAKQAAACEFCRPGHTHIPAGVALGCLAGLVFGVLVWWVWL